MIKQTLIVVPLIPFLTAARTLTRRCPRCRKRIKEGESYLNHATEAKPVHSTCLRTGQSKQYRGKQ